MRIQDLNKKLLRFLGNNLIGITITSLCSSLKINFTNKQFFDNLLNSNQNFVMAFWHRTMLIPWYLGRDKNFSGLVSASKDGDILTTLLNKWNYSVVRGSSSVGGKISLESTINNAINGKCISITPDGPRGPIFKMKAGAVVIAKKAGIPLILCGINFNNRWIFNKSWDKMEIPKFFSSVNVVFSEPIMIDKDLSYEKTSEMIKEMENRLINLQTLAEKS